MCANIVGISEDTYLSKSRIVEGLKKIASDWQAGAEETGQDLVEEETSVALLLYDVMEALGFTYQEMEAVLKQDLVKVKMIVGDPITVSA